MHTLLVANRGEIARRILRTARDRGLRTVAVFTDADADLPYVHEADVAVRIGEGSVGSSYLDGDKVIDAAQRAGADAIHPGYGFLSENADFAQAVVDAGLTWVGPPPAAMIAMSDKSAARQLAAGLGVPVLPGYDGDDQDEATLRQHAEHIGLPLLIKATAGGGGRGMRRVDDLDDLGAALASARREAGAAFGSERVLLERYVLQPRHIEVQVFGDQHGHVIHLGERECSIQRRHQKVVEEAPSPGVDADLRARLGQAACTLAQAVGYVGAGTVEFILEADGRFWFLEMNTRLQVEHPVTECITGQDLVAWQLAVADGEPLPWTQDDVVLSGHAIEVRLVAEDPLRDYLPATGTLVRLDLPTPSGVRVDSGFVAGNVLSPYYDSLVAKIIAHGPDRTTATRRLQRALDGAWMPGPASNLPLLKQILATDAWLAGALHTGFLEQNGLPVAPPHNTLDGVLAAVVAGWCSRGPHSQPAGWRLAGPAVQRDTYTSFGVTVAATWQSAGDGLIVTLSDGEAERTCAVTSAELSGDALTAVVDGVRQRWRVCTADGGPVTDGRTVYVHLGAGREALVRLEPRHPAPAGATADPDTLTAQTPGTVVAVHVAAGDSVVEGQALVVLEAMKMEHSSKAARDGVVEAILVEVGEAVVEGAVLVRLVE